jgi:hypothetical protein
LHIFSKYAKFQFVHHFWKIFAVQRSLCFFLWIYFVENLLKYLDGCPSISFGFRLKQSYLRVKRDYCTKRLAVRFSKYFTFKLLLHSTIHSVACTPFYHTFFVIFRHQSKKFLHCCGIFFFKLNRKSCANKQLYVFLDLLSFMPLTTNSTEPHRLYIQGAFIFKNKFDYFFTSSR